MSTAKGKQQQTRQRYAELARRPAESTVRPERLVHLQSLGYPADAISHLPAAAELCLGCGNPVAIASLGAGESVLDLGCGGGLDVFLAAQAVGRDGRVIGVDASPEMVARARQNAAAGGFCNTEFVVAAIEALPWTEAVFDVVLSNCVLNHCPDKAAAFAEARRVLKPGGRLCVTDLVTAGEFAAEALNDAIWGEWLRGALPRAGYLAAICSAGFREITVVSAGVFGSAEQDPRLRGRISSLAVTAVA